MLQGQYSTVSDKSAKTKLSSSFCLYNLALEGGEQVARGRYAVMRCVELMLQA